MLLSSTTNNYRMPATSSSTTTTSQSPRVRIRNLHVCEPSFPSRDVVRRENYSRRKAQESQGWSCPRNIPYQGIDPVHLSAQTLKFINDEQSTNVTPRKSISKLPTSATSSSQLKSILPSQDENLVKTQYDLTMRRLQTAQIKHMKKSSDILKKVQLGHSVKDAVGKFSRRSSSKVETVDMHGTSSVSGDDKESDIAYDMLLDDFDEDDDNDGESVSDIRDDIMSPRTVTNTNITSTGTAETSDFQKHFPPELSLIPMKLCQSAPPLNRNNLRQATLRPFTPRYNSLSARLRLTRHMPFRDALYRQLCCILWLLRAMGRLDWPEPISGCWNIDRWLRSESRSSLQYHPQTKKQQESNKGNQTKFLTTESKFLSSTTNPNKENPIISLRPPAAQNDNMKRHSSIADTSLSRFFDTSTDTITGRRSMLSDTSDRLDLQMNSISNEPDLNESASSKSNQGDATENTNIDVSQLTTNVRSTVATPAILTTNTSRTSVSGNAGPSTGRGPSGRLTSIMERRRSPDMLLKRWIKNQRIRPPNSDETLPLTEAQLRLLHVGDNDDLKKIFGLENTSDASNKEQIHERRTREIERKQVVNTKRRPMTCGGLTNSKRHAQILNKIKRDFNDFTEEQSIILNNKLEQVDNDRLFYCQTKLRDLQEHMPPLTILDRLLKHIRYDDDRKKINATYLKYQSWYVDLLQMVQPDYSNDPIILLLIKEMEEFANPSDKPTVIRFKAVLTDLRPHEICHPDIMAAIEFMRIHVVRMGNEEFDKFFCKQFPTVTKYIATQPGPNEHNNVKEETKSTI